MDEKNIKELRKIINIFNNVKIKEFLNVEKIFNSELFFELLKLGTDQAKLKNDFRDINNFFKLFEGTIYERDYINHVRKHVNFILTDKSPRTFLKAKDETQMQRSLNIFEAREKEKISELEESKFFPKKIDNEEKSQDLMNTRLILPGSFGSSRRR